MARSSCGGREMETRHQPLVEDINVCEKDELLLVLVVVIGGGGGRVWNSQQPLLSFRKGNKKVSIGCRQGCIFRFIEFIGIDAMEISAMETRVCLTEANQVKQKTETFSFSEWSMFKMCVNVV